MLRLTDLREILRYVPQFRDRVFVIALDGAVVEDENFRNLLLDIALLRSLRIGVALVHGAGHQIRRLAEQTGQTPSNLDGTGITDAATLQLALTAANRVTHEILEGLSATDLRGACGNALVAHPAGILHGVDHQFTGRVERVDTALLHALLEHDIVPVIPPLGCDGEGHTYRLNSDAVAVEVARALQAVKLIYLTTFQASASVAPQRRGELLRQLSVEEAEALLKKHRAELPAAAGVQAGAGGAGGARRRAARPHHRRPGRGRAARRGVLQRGHRHAGPRQRVPGHPPGPAEGRPGHLHADPGRAWRTTSWCGARGPEIERQIDDFFVFEVDRNPVACVALHFYPEREQGGAGLRVRRCRATRTRASAPS